MWGLFGCCGMIEFVRNNGAIPMIAARLPLAVAKVR
jgi:hypothetical protein